jgi:TonB family protein
MIRSSVRAVLLLLPLVLATALQAQSNEIQNSLQGHYHDKIFFLRGMFSGDQLQYDSTGMPLDNPSVGFWTTNGFILITDLSVDSQNFVIRGRRMIVVADEKGFYFLGENPKKRNKARNIEIRVRTAPGATSTEIDALIGKVFLTGSDSLIAFLPTYWRTCVSAGLYRVNDPKYERCSFSPEVLSVPGVNVPRDLSASLQPVLSSPIKFESARVFKVGSGISPPQLVFSPEPQFTSTAQELNFAGVVTLGLIVDDKGVPRNVEIIGPLGAGLDEQAVSTISTWRFKPAMKDKQSPVATQIAIQVDFHRY